MLVVHWLRLCTFSAGSMTLIPRWELRYPMCCRVWPKKPQTSPVFTEYLPFIEHSRSWKRLTFSLYSGNVQFSWICRTYSAAVGHGASQVMLVIKSPPANAGDLKMWVQSLGGEDPIEQGMAAHSSILAWRIPWTEEPRGLQFMGLQSQTRLTQLGRHACMVDLQCWVSAIQKSELVIHISTHC